MNLKEDLPKNKYIEKAYDLIINNKELSNEEIHLHIVESNFNKNTFGWRLFEHITKNAKNYHSVLYKDSINSLKTFFKLFPDNKKALKYTYKKMFANMILGLGRTGFSIRTKNELECVLADFKQLGFSCSKYEVFKVIYNKLLKKRGIISHYHFEKLSYFLDFEKDLESLLSDDNEEILIIATLAEKYKDNKFYRFKKKGDRELLNYYLDEARKIDEKNNESLRKKSELYLKSIKIAMAYGDNIIQFCFSNYFYTNSQICYFNDNRELSLICYDFAQYFFKLRKKKYEQKISEAYYYECLAYFYKKEKRYDDQEIALASYVKSYKDLVSFKREKYIKRYYRSLLKYIYVKVKNSLYKNEYQDCLNICNNFLRNQYQLISSLLKGNFVEDIFFIIKAYKEEVQARLFFEQSDFSNALKRVEKALLYQNKRSLDYKIKEVKNLERYKLYLSARENSSRGNNKHALEILKQIFQLYYKFEYMPLEYMVFYQILKSKNLIEIEKISLAKSILKNVIENEKIQESFGELYDNSKELYEIIINYKKHQLTEEKIEALISDVEDSIDKINLWNYQQYSLPIQQIKAKYLKLDITDSYFSHIINQYEKRIGIHISKDNNRNYPIFEKIILNNIKFDEKSKEYVKMYRDIGQTDPILISYTGIIIDGNKRLATIKLSNILDSVSTDKGFISNNFVRIVQLPKDLPTKELSILKSAINNQFKYELNKPFDVKDLILLLNLVNNEIKRDEICDIFSIDFNQISIYRSLYDLMEEFLEENSLEKDFYIIEKFDIFEHFEVLNSELSKLGVYTGIGGRELILMKEKIKNMTFLWLRNNIDKNFVSKKKILKAKMIKKFKFIINDPVKSSIIDQILNQEIEDKKRIQILFTGLVKKIKISEERRSCLKHSKMLQNRINLLSSKLKRTELSSFEKEEIFNLLEESYNNLSKLILAVKNN